MPARREFPAPLVIATFMTVVAIYVGAYAMLVEPRERLRMQGNGCCRMVREPHYRTGGEVTPVLFYPISQIDYWIRPGFWQS